MASFIRIHYPAQHAGVARVEQAIKTIGGYSATHALLHGLAVLGTPFTRLAARARLGMAAWREERKQREEDRKLWNLALTDARVMADLSRAMSQDALRDGSRYF
ncbi:hypothetical protein [Ramlibacter sp. AN1133]|uniref:hypothetical protein n=1 Tax=Ramlibacter sp. AN1133 TaxID=3133429 RepID=UPI0030C533D8